MNNSEKIIKMIKAGVGTSEYLEALSHIYKVNKINFHSRLTKGKYQLPKEIAQDIYHHSIVILVQKIQQNKIANQNIPAYLWGICHKLFLQHQDKNIRTQVNNKKYSQENTSIISEENVEDKLQDEAYRKLVGQIFDSIGEKCQKILLWRQMNYSYREIAQKLNPEAPSSDDVMRVLAGRCTKKLIQLVNQKPELKQQIDELLM